MEKVRKSKRPYIIAGIVSLLLGLTIFLLFFLIQDQTMLSACDGTAYASIALICGSGLIYITRTGFFDFATYGFRQLGNMVFSKKANKDNDYVAYREVKKEERKSGSNYYIVVFFVGALFLLTSIVLIIIRNSSI